MNRGIKLLVVPFLVLFLFAGGAMALTLDGNMKDWNSAHYTDGEEYPYNNTGQVFPGWGGQFFDVEKIGFFTDGTTAYFGLQTGFDFIDSDGFDYNGSTYFAGDIFIDFGQDGVWEIAIDISGGDLGDIYLVNDFTIPAYNTSAPYSVIGTDIGDVTSSASANYFNDINEQTYGIEGSFDLSTTLTSQMLDDLFSDGAIIHWTMSCGNDVLEHRAAPVPEPATMLLLGIGLIGLAGVSRKKFNK
ncbi:MAG: PEP-CTERM sorting domain-containing protein [Desulfosarcina sp.]|nr:PEP-CTERM sorting domain-containing protein [Desulfosarcina sp.]MBC2765866.1 PEP-CTERM sorting domain-containing protein [Desulfosarcina sp.]